MKKNNLLFLLSLCTIILFTQCKKDPEKCSVDDTESIKGCTDSTATNFDANADCDDGSCTFPPEKCSTEDTESVRGCMDSAATNYNADAECDDNSCEYALTQESLNSANQIAVDPLTGGTFPHGGMGLTGEQTIREIFTNDGTVASEISPGYAITKHTYAKDSLGNKADLLVTFAMLKHGEGYWEDTNNWEYIRIPADPTVDYTVNPNGILANANLSGNMHDENPGCVNCHNGAGGGDQLFSND